MTRKRHTEEQIIAVMEDAQAGIGVQELCRKHGISDATFYKWRAKYACLEVSNVKKHPPVRTQLTIRWARFHERTRSFPGDGDDIFRRFIRRCQIDMWQPVSAAPGYGQRDDDGVARRHAANSPRHMSHPHEPLSHG